MGSFENKWNLILDEYYKANFDNIRFFCSSILSSEVLKDIEKVLARTRSTEQTFDLPCLCKSCPTVEEATECSEWTKELGNIIFKDFKDIKSTNESFNLINALFWYIHGSAYERWEDSFDYISINCQLHVARQLILLTRGLLENPLPEHLIMLDSLELLSYRIHHSVLVENSMITNNAKSMLFHSQEAEKYSALIKAKLEAEIYTIEWIKNYSNRLLEIISEYKLYEERLNKLILFIEMRQNHPKQFLIEFPKANDDLGKYLEDIEAEGNFENASEYRSHLRCLELHWKQLHNPQLKLQQVHGSISYGFYLNLSELAILIQPGNEDNPSEEKISEGTQVNRAAKVLEYITEKLKDENENSIPFSLRNEDFILYSEDVAEDPSPDILDFSIGSEHFKNVQINFPAINVRSLRCSKNEDTKILFKLQPRLMHYALGIGSLNFTFEIPELSIAQFHALKNLAAPHSGQYEFIWQSEEEQNKGNRIFIAPILKDLAKKIIEIYKTKLLGFIEDVGKLNEIDTESEENLIKRDSPVEIEHSWFTNFTIYRITDDQSKKTYCFEDLKSHWEYPGLIAYQRADKASIDDWVDIDVDALRISNIAQIRAHKGDFFIVGENNAISYFPDDPHFIVKQYEETAKWVFLIQSLAKNTLRNCQKAVAKFEQKHILENFMKNNSEERDTPEELIFHQIYLQKIRMVAIHAVDHVSAIYISQYADHTLLLKKAFNTSGINNIIRAVQSKISDLDELLKTVDLLIRHVQEEREKQQEEREKQRDEQRKKSEEQDKKRDRKINGLIGILGIAQIVLVGDLFYKIILTKNDNDLVFSKPTIADYGWFLWLFLVLFISIQLISSKVFDDSKFLKKFIFNKLQNIWRSILGRSK